MRRFLLFLCLLALPLAAQKFPFSYSYSAALVATPAVVTVQIPAGTTYALKAVTFKGASVYCSVECAFTLERDGTPATATAGTPQSVNRSSPSPYALAFYASDVGTGTTIGAYTVPAGGTLVLDLSAKRLTNPGENVTIRTASVTGTVKIVLQWDEQ